MPLTPQPDVSCILPVRRYYTSLKACPTYKRRVTWIDSELTPPVAVFEYIGSFPGQMPHDNTIAKQNVCTYTRTMDKIRQGVLYVQPMKVHDDQLKDNSMCDGPRNLRQVRIVKYRPTEKKKNRVKDDGFTNVKLTNFADHYQHAHHMLHSHPFVQHVANSKDKSPVLILYTNKQLIDLVVQRL